MQTIETKIDGVLLIPLDPFTDRRGTFVRTYSRAAFHAHGLSIDPAECNVVWNRETGTLRGLHEQIGADAQAKMILCLAGRIHDVVLDLRPDSDTYGCSLGHTLGADEPTVLTVPTGCAHGYQTLTGGACVSYMMSAAYAPDSERGVRWNDPAFEIEWPIADPVVSDKDRSYPDFQL